MLGSGMFIKACFLVLAVAATDDYDTCEASPGGCAAQTDADATTLMQADARISAGLAPYLKAEAGKNEAIKSEDFDLAKKFKSELHDVQNQRKLLQKDKAAAKKKAEENAAETLAALISKVEAKKKTAIGNEDFALAKKANSELHILQNQAAEAVKAKKKAEEEAAKEAAQDALAAEKRKAEEAAVEQAARHALRAAREKKAQDALAAEEKKAEQAAVEKAAEDARKANLMKLEAQKAEAVKTEDFDLAMSLKSDIQDLHNQAKDEAAAKMKAKEETSKKMLAMEIIELEAQKIDAIRIEDFDLAKNLRSEIQDMQKKNGKGGGAAKRTADALGAEKKADKGDLPAGKKAEKDGAHKTAE